MASKILSISIPEDLMNFLNENQGLSPSKVFQSALLNIQSTINHNPQLIESIKQVNLLKKVIQRMQEDIQKATEFITIKGHWEEYSKNEN